MTEEELREALRDEIAAAICPGDYCESHSECVRDAEFVLTRPRMVALLASAEGGTGLIAAERQRQVDVEGWTPEHDAEHADEALALAACCYAVPPQMRKYRLTGAGSVPTLWPWHPGWWKPSPDDRVRELVKAGALIAAEIDRLRAVLAAAIETRQPYTDAELDAPLQIDEGRLALERQTYPQSGRATETRQP